MKKTGLLFSAACIIALTLCSCSGKDDPDPKPDPKPDPDPVEEYLKVSPLSLTFEASSAPAQTLTVDSNLKWTASADAGWVTLTPSSDLKALSVAVQDNVCGANEEPAERTAIVKVSANGLESSAVITQKAGEKPVPPAPTSIKLLAIGNSFSADAVEQELYGLLAGAGYTTVIIGDMYIGGCPLDKHAANAKSDAAAYSYRKIVNGNMTKTADVKLSTALKDEQWDFISVQEGAGYHGFYNTTYKGTTHSMEPALTDLINYVKANSANKNFKLIYHAPWVAQKDYTGTKFSYYGFDQAVMYKMICEATQQVLAAHKEIDLFMNSMDAVQNARTSFIGDNMCRDGWHMNYSVGRYTVGCLWCEKLTGKSVVGNPYHPTTVSDARTQVCQEAAHQAVEHPYQTTDLSYIPKPADDDPGQANVKVLAKWYFSPARAKSDGCIKTWTGQDQIGVYRYSNEPGERGYYNANEAGSGKLSYVQIDKKQWADKGDAAGLSVFDVSNGGQPVMSAPMPGDYWLFETTGGYEFEEGTRLHMIYTYNPGNYGAKYWMIEYMDGEEWKPAFEKSKTTISLSGESIEYNVAYTSSQKIIEFTVTLENPTKEFKVRQLCCSEYQVNDKWFAYPNVKCVSRIAGDPANEAKPLPEMDQILN